MSLKAKLEAVIYAAEEPVTLTQLAVLFAADALELKAQQDAASPNASGQNPPTAEPASLLLQGFEYLGLDQSRPEGPVVDAPQETVAAKPESDSLSSDLSSTQDTALAEGLQPSPELAEIDAATELETKRLARLHDREVRATIRTLLDELIDDYISDERGVEIREIAGGFRMATKPEYHDAVRSFVKSLRPALKLSLPALETLAVIAYKQPVTAPEVNEIRGVDSSATFGSLLARKLIATAGRKQVIGRPILYKTTREFLLRFGLKDVTELPSMEEFEKMASLELDEPEPESDAEPAAATTMDLALELDETDYELVGQGFSPDTDADESSGDAQAAEKLIALKGHGFSRAVSGVESSGALAPEVSSSTNPAAIPQSPETTQTAETAGSIEPSSTPEAAPAAPPATEQAETENFPHGEEVQEER
jgi:segregation and condensation protein B